ncbi:hypothetical protein HPB50_016147 [Hyalomma asiaticum]|uniref:Uncharacterized protein n=1 Tax=Hyalomma asiaticum TaxID=266040 RepID=A0ACB7RQ76_HYAAI|nr:hypothetical protein HPB50_016147 [Hyalomma asiaticum]
MGQDAPHENLTDDSDWTVVKTRQQRRRQEKSSPSNNIARSTPTLSSYQQGTRPHRIKGKIIRAGRMPRLPKEHDKVIIRPQGGLNVTHTPAPLLISAILAAAGLKKEDANEDILSPNRQQNIIVASSPSPVHTQRYKQIKQRIINNKSYDVNAYATTPGQTSKAVIRGIPLDYDNKTIEEEIIGSCNPLALAARRLGNNSCNHCVRWPQSSKNGSHTLIVGGDFNATEKQWGYGYSSFKGRQLAQDALDMNLILITDPTNPTRTGSSTTRDTTPEFTFVTSSSPNNKMWRNTSIDLGSDHMIIEVKIPTKDNQQAGRHIEEPTDTVLVSQYLNADSGDEVRDDGGTTV